MTRSLQHDIADCSLLTYPMHLKDILETIRKLEEEPNSREQISIAINEAVVIKPGSQGRYQFDPENPTYKADLSFPMRSLKIVLLASDLNMIFIHI